MSSWGTLARGGGGVEDAGEETDGVSGEWSDKEESESLRMRFDMLD